MTKADAMTNGESATHGDGTTATTQRRPLTLPELRAAIPADCFVKSPLKSMAYMARDIGLFLGMFGGMTMAMQTPAWRNAPPALTNATLLVYWIVNGFVMWCMFVVGHDAGHGSFSDSTLLNAICGHVSHAPLLVPFWTWAESHRRHHQYHNHFHRDYSFPWFVKDTLKAMGARVAHSLRVTFPFTGWLMYLGGTPDGGHWVPFGGRLWQSASVKRYTRGAISSISVVVWAYIVGEVSGWDFATAFKLYGGCWFVFSFWLVTVTYLQHHSESSTVYDGDWTFLRGAFETIDREYGSGIDNFHHHITECHVVHHLFFTSIPHYNLPRATAALQAFLDQRGLGKLRKVRKQHDFFFEVFKTLYKHSFLAKRASKEELEASRDILPDPRIRRGAGASGSKKHS